MFCSIAVHFINHDEEIEEVPRKKLRDISNILEMSRNQFIKNFRVSKEIFTHILQELQLKWSPAYRSTHIRPDIQLAIFLRFVATGSYQQAVGKEHFSRSKATVCRIIAECLELFKSHICPKWIKMPLPEEEDAIKQAFWKKHGFPGIIGCVDGTHIRIKAPGSDEKHLYCNGKGFYSINAMIVCDHKMVITYVDARHPGSKHDSFIWEHSDVNQQLQREFDEGKRNTFILGDGGYKLLPYLMTPFRNPSTTYERRYNQKHKSARNVVERCFGVLKNRFRCIIGARGLHYSPEKAAQIINSCCALHNMCIQFKCAEEPNILPEESVNDDVSCSDVLDDRAVDIRANISIKL